MHAGLARARGARDRDDGRRPPERRRRTSRSCSRRSSRADVASGRRVGRRDSIGRTLPSRVINGLLRRFTGVPISDFGCAFNAYRRDAIEPLLGSIGKQKFTKALVLASGASVEEVDVGHAAAAERLALLAVPARRGSRSTWSPASGRSRCSGSASRSALVCTLAAAALGVYGVVYWIDHGNFPGPLFAGAGIVFVLGVEGFILALIGEYLGRIQRDVEGRPLYTVEEEL